MSLVEHETAPAAPAPDDNLNDSALALSARQLAHLAELREIGMALARDLGKRASERTAKDHGFDIGLAFARVARAVRQIVALEQEIAGLRETRRKQVLHERRFDNKQSVRRAVRNAMDADRPDLSHAQVNLSLQRIFNDYDDYGDFDYAAGSVGEIVAEICNDLGIAPPDPALWAAEADDSETSTVVPLLGSETRVDARNEYGHDEKENDLARPRRTGTGPP